MKIIYFRLSKQWIDKEIIFENIVIKLSDVSFLFSSKKINLFKNILKNLNKKRTKTALPDSFVIWRRKGK